MHFLSSHSLTKSAAPTMRYDFEEMKNDFFGRTQSKSLNCIFLIRQYPAKIIRYFRDNFISQNVSSNWGGGGGP
jgi:hypothetical protein